MADDSCVSLSGQSKVDCYTQKISDTQSQEKTLSSQIDLINTKISRTKSQITVTQDKLDRLNENIASVTGKITVLEGTLNQVSDILANRIVQTYVEGRTDPVLYLLSASDFQDFFQRFEYMRIVQKHDKQVMVQMAASRKNYNDQKTELEQVKKQQEILSAQLQSQKIELDHENRDKQQLLTETQNDESRYQQLLAQAKAQLAAFNSFVNLEGGDSLLSNQTKCDDWGCYYNQRDSSWGAMALNHTGYTLANSGCLVTSMAMVITHYGHKDVTPVTINNDSSNFAIYYPAFLNKTINAGGSWRREGISYSQIDGELSSGKPVIVGIGAGPSHFVVLVSGSNGDYKMNDPYVENGKDISFTSKYSINSISEIDTVRQN